MHILYAKTWAFRQVRANTLSQLQFVNASSILYSTHTSIHYAVIMFFKPFPLLVLESRQNGLPLVVARCGEVVQIIRIKLQILERGGGEGGEGGRGGGREGGGRGRGGERGKNVAVMLVSDVQAIIREGTCKFKLACVNQVQTTSSVIFS